MNTRSGTIIGAGVVVAVLGAAMVFAYARSVSGQTDGMATAPAWVVTEDVAAGTKWEDLKAKVAQKRVPEDVRPASAVTDTSELAGLMSVRPISSGEVVTASQFGAARTSPRALEIPPGHNGVTINLGVPQGVARYVQAGDLVNVYVSFKGAGPDGETITKLMLSNVQVLSHNIASAAPVDKASGVATGGEVLLTVAVTPDAAERLIFARENGSVWVGLVNPQDGPAATGGRTFETVLN